MIFYGIAGRGKTSWRFLDRRALENAFSPAIEWVVGLGWWNWGAALLGFGLLAFCRTLPQCSGPHGVEIFIRVSAKTPNVPNPGVFAQIELGFLPGNRL